MNANGHFEEDDLALYAMHLLAEPEASAVAREVAERDDVRQQLAQVQQQLGAYAQTEVQLEPVPAGSLNRLLEQIAREKKQPANVVAMSPAASTPARPRSSRAGVLPWIGWAVAAAMAVAAGKLYQDRMALHHMLTAQTGAVVHLSADTMDVYRERDALKANVSEQTQQIATLQAEAAAAKSTATGLEATVAGQSSKLNDQTSKLNQQTSRVSEQTALAASAAHERDVLRGTVAAQAGQVAELTGEAARARQVLEALTDRSALRVTLTKPKSNPAPTGRATYIASRGTLVFLANNLAALQPNKVYELWLMPADNSSPVPAGTFAPDARGNASLVYAQFPRAVPAKGFAVTIENEGGSQKPTLPIVLAGL